MSGCPLSLPEFPIMVIASVLPQLRGRSRSSTLVGPPDLRYAPGGPTPTISYRAIPDIHRSQGAKTEDRYAPRQKTEMPTEWGEEFSVVSFQFYEALPFGHQWGRRQKTATLQDRRQNTSTVDARRSPFPGQGWLSSAVREYGSLPPSS